MKDYSFSTKVPFNKELEDKIAKVFKNLMKEELDKSMNKIISEIAQLQQEYSLLLYYINTDRNSNWPPKYLKIDVKFSLNDEGDEGSARNIGIKLFQEIENPIRQNIINAMGNDSRLEYKPVDSFICSRLS
jgi:hypothetical protein